MSNLTMSFLHFKHDNIALRVPSQVTGLSLSKTMSSGFPGLRVTWTTPQSELPITRYNVQYKTSRDISWGSEYTISGSPPLTSIILRRLDASTEYNVRVRAVSADGDGMWSVVLTERTYGSEFFIFIVIDVEVMVLIVTVKLYTLGSHYQITPPHYQMTLQKSKPSVSILIHKT